MTNGQDTWSARCGESRTPGAASGSGKRASRKAGTAPRPDSTGRFYHSVLDPLFYRINTYLLRWIRKKYRLGWRAAIRKLAEGYRLRPRYFAHWIWTPPTGR